MKAEMVMKKENNKWYIGWIIFPAWYLIGKKYIILPVIQSVFETMSYSDAYLITNYLWNFIAILLWQLNSTIYAMNLWLFLI